MALQRISSLISGFFALGRIRYADLFQDHPEHLRSILLETHIQQTYDRDLRNLNLQERRLRNHRDRNIAELQALQAERREREESRLKLAVRAYQECRAKREAFNPARFGFEFSIEQMEKEIGRREAEQYAEERAKELRAARHAA